MTPAIVSIAGNFAVVLGVFLSNGYVLLAGAGMVTVAVAWSVAGILRDGVRDLIAARVADRTLRELRRK